MPHRIVGSYEYLNTIRYFEELLNRSTEEEIKVYDRIISDRPEFSFYSGVTIDLGVPQLDFTDAKTRSEFDQSYRRNSLTWLLAIARVEVNATASMYGNIKNPFAWNRTSTVGMREYYQVLLDDSAAHLMALVNDPELKDIVNPRKPLNANVLPNLIRLKLVSDMLAAIYGTNDVALMRQVEPYMKETNSAVESIIAKIYARSGAAYVPYQEGSVQKFRGKALQGCIIEMQQEFAIELDPFRR